VVHQIVGKEVVSSLKVEAIQRVICKKDKLIAIRVGTQALKRAMKGGHENEKIQVEAEDRM
jgi:hypothetical protein